jgi:hypothetical protein
MPFRNALVDHSILFMNRGSHFVETETVLKELEETLLDLRQHYEGLDVFFKFTPFAVPRQLKTALPSASFVELVPNDEDDSFGWARFPAQNKAVATMLRERFPEVVGVSPEVMLGYRTDCRQDGGLFKL